MKCRLLLAVLLACASGAHAGEGRSEAPLQDPWVPPATRMKRQGAHETRGAELRAQVEHKLREGFVAADSEGRGSITREQARAAQLGYVADNFDAIDEARAGRVSFEDVKRFLRKKGAKNL